LKTISQTDLILNADGSVYHLHLLPYQIADTIIVVGDPERVPMVSKYFDSIEYQIHKREFVTHTGYIDDKRLTVISSGIGTDNVEILMNELDALANINLTTRTPNQKHKALQIIRVGTSGSIQADLAVDSFFISKAAIGIDSLNDFYKFDQSTTDTEICENFKSYLEINSLPYFAKSSDHLFNNLQKNINLPIAFGLTLTCPGFYAPQGRKLKYEVKDEALLTKFTNYNFDCVKLSNLEMETAGYYLFAQILGHEMISINAILANRTLNQFSQNPEKQVDTLIRATLEVLCKL
jgi:uridine phosphorylase